MATNPALKLFGSELRSRLLIYLALLEETYVPELAGLLKLSRVTVRRALENLEREGYVSSVLAGRERWVRLNPRNPVAEPLRVLLMRLAEGYPQLVAEAATLRRRPRRRGKRLVSADEP
jgi:DNA-binding transcriptional ArsR family regulator